MKRNPGNPFAIVQEWWGVILVAIGVLCGYFWLEQNFAKLDKLNSEKCFLTYEIRITKADIEFTNVDEEIDLQRSELEDLLQIADAPQELIEFKRGAISSLEERSEQISQLRECLRRWQGSCFDGAETEKCFD